MKDAFYFSHDSNSRHDPKITAMRSVYGSEGYGWFWMLVEMMREADEYKLEMKSKYAFNAYAMQLHSTSINIESFIKDCIHEFELFQTDGTHFWSPSLKKRMEMRNNRSEKAKAAAEARWSKSKNNEDDDADAMQMHIDLDANACKNDALKESKVKESKEKKKRYADFVTLTESEYQKLVSAYGEDNTGRMIDVLDNYKGSKNKKYASDYRAILNWVVERVMGKVAPKKQDKVVASRNREVEFQQWVQEGNDPDGFDWS